MEGLRQQRLRGNTIVVLWSDYGMPAFYTSWKTPRSSVIANKGSMEYWAVNSYAIHATSHKPEGPCAYVADAFGVMSHAVDVKRGPAAPATSLAVCL